MYSDNEVAFSNLLGKVLAQVNGAEDGSDVVRFTTQDGVKYDLSHDQDCCESVRVSDVCGDVADLIGEPILLAEEVVNPDDTPTEPVPCESGTWTFYKLGTRKGSVTLRWLGESNGYYSERVTFRKY